MTTVLVIRSPGKAGIYHMPIKVIYKQDNNTYTLGEPF